MMMIQIRGLSSMAMNVNYPTTSSLHTTRNLHSINTQRPSTLAIHSKANDNNGRRIWRRRKLLLLLTVHSG
ncbi:hypothetical protein HanLR1_Chr07g0260411 [Helianthus annuus]|nr:hypothetical protein HanLR1_Chr07g0260411 [Helianthus annuus]